MKMNNISDVAAGLSYGTSLGSGGYWLLQLMDTVSPGQWSAIGVLASVFFGLLTYLTNLYFKIKDYRQKKALSDGEQK